MQQQDVAKLMAEQERLEREEAGGSRTKPRVDASSSAYSENTARSSRGGVSAEERKAQAQARLAKLKADAEAAEITRLEAEIAAEEARVAQTRLREEREAREKLEQKAREAKDREKQRLEKQSTKLAKEIEKLAGRLKSKGFVDKAPPAVVDKARAELAELEDQASKVETSLAALS